MDSAGNKTEAGFTFDKVDWQAVAGNMHHLGYSLVPNIFPESLCDEFIAGYSDTCYRKTVVMERHRFGIGEYKYFEYPLPAPIRFAREAIYPKLVPIANEWMTRLKIDRVFPESIAEFQECCRAAGQTKPTPLILKYGPGGFNTLHQDLYGEVYFPMQLAFFLNKPGIDYTGGEFVLTQQVPRAQSKATVLRPGKGAMIVFATNFRPVEGNRGHYRSAMRHGVSEVLSGERHTLGIIFHDAIN